MYFKLSKGTAWLITFSYLMSYSQGVYAQQSNKNTEKVVELSSSIQFSATPMNCVTLRQGRNCFAKISLTWQVEIAGDFCIYQKQNGEQIQCWNNSRGNQTFLEFESNDRLDYQLIASKEKKVVTETVINVSWVHKATPRKRRWRIF